MLIRMRRICCMGVAIWILLAGIPGETRGAKRVAHSGYEGCIELANETTRVVLCPACGGRLLEYSLDDKNALHLEAAQEGWTYEPGKPDIDPYGGRFDIGPEMIVPRHPDLWLGAWTGAITGPRSARLTSRQDKATGVQLIRDFSLAADSSKLTCTQTIKNVSAETRTWCHWSRTLAAGHGICLVPLEGLSRFPHKYIMYEDGPRINYRPQDPNIRIRAGFLEILDTPKYPKLGIDSYAGSLCYLSTNDLLFVKRFPTYPDRVYSEVAAITISIWYDKDIMCELEPIGPMEKLKPGESASFTETWWLLPYPFPADRTAVDLAKVTEAMKRHAR